MRPSALEMTPRRYPAAASPESVSVVPSATWVHRWSSPWVSVRILPASFMRSSGTPVTLAAYAECESVIFKVSDFGPGIAADILPHIFERFYRGQASRTGGGAGLGLSIARELIEAQGGTITVESRPGRGTTFMVTMPLAPLSVSG